MKLFNKHISHVPYTDLVRIFILLLLLLFFFFCCFGFEFLKELGLYIISEHCDGREVVGGRGGGVKGTGTWLDELEECLAKILSKLCI